MTFTQIITLNYTNIFEFDWFFDTNTVKLSFLHLPEFGSHQLVVLRGNLLTNGTRELPTLSKP